MASPSAGIRDGAELGAMLARFSCSDAIPEKSTTTLMFRRLPRSYTTEELVCELNSEGFEGMYDFLYVPWNKVRHANISYAFINFVSVEWTSRCFLRFSERPWSACASNKLCHVSPAHIQGLNANLLLYVTTNGLPWDSRSHLPLVFQGSQRVDLRSAVRAFCHLDPDLVAGGAVPRQCDGAGSCGLLMPSMERRSPEGALGQMDTTMKAASALSDLDDLERRGAECGPSSSGRPCNAATTRKQWITGELSGGGAVTCRTAGVGPSSSGWPCNAATTRRQWITSEQPTQANSGGGAFEALSRLSESIATSRAPTVVTRAPCAKSNAGARALDLPVKAGLQEAPAQKDGIQESICICRTPSEDEVPGTALRSIYKER
eukprot:CAMPEP_0197909918 /NCGR_PEP_ID=MMETSP1439-20131203/69869_1 /TAXON_ID=66791 /ORGANISM="Gonyaulax spinifera, Strain CCMP409" /LENGTH=375 /DNA_ID=CAMNT_0043531531 /DNA_START=40 /DNA_END=1167 /DNA_ORIENTATION=-